jgi:succinate dehydrogenase / fumarate reductase iron-sulfur subunit
MAGTKQQPRDVLVKIRRYDPDRGAKHYWQDFNLNIKPGTTVLDVLHEIKATKDQSLAMRYSCRMGVCGSCGMLINGTPTLACNTQVLEVAAGVLTVAPLPNFNTIKDLVPDLKPLFDKHGALFPNIQREDAEEMENPSREYYQSEEELVEYLQFTYCIKCASCMAACPTFATDKEGLKSVKKRWEPIMVHSAAITLESAPMYAPRGLIRRGQSSF